MNKKTSVIIGVIVILATLFLNLIFSNSSENTDLTFYNVNALAGGESSEPAQCIESGTICVGWDANGVWSRHQGLQFNPKL